METTSNVFKAVSSDFDTLNNDQTSVMLDNCVIAREPNNQYSVKPFPGNTERFTVTAGFKPIAVTSIENIVFVLSVNGDTVELGSYPTPVGGTLQPVYAPLSNYTGGAFRTNLFGIDNSGDIYDKVNLIATPSFDESFDILIMDGIHPNRMINCGFTRNGASNDRTYDAADFATVINQQLTISRWADIYGSDYQVIGGGSLKNGNYFIFIRLMDEAYNKTPFLFSGGPLAVFSGQGDSACSSIQSSKSDERSDKKIIVSDERSDKKIIVTVRNLDTTYSYFEVGVFRYFSTAETLTHDAWLMPNRFAVSAGTISFDIIGTETQVEITDTELMKTMPLLNACKAGVINNSRFFGVNWSGSNKDNAKERAIVGLVKPVPFYKDVAVEYNQPNTMAYSSYMPGEIYPFFGVIEYKDGTTSQPYPIKGKDFIQMGYQFAVATEYNDSGLVRFPDFGNVTYLGFTGLAQMARALGINFDLTDVETYMQANPGEFVNSISGIRIMRGEKVDNLICTGVGIRCLNKVWTRNYNAAQRDNGDMVYSTISCGGLTDKNLTFIGFNKVANVDGAVNYPYYSMVMPTYRIDNCSNVGALQGYYDDTNGRNFAIFSPDLMFSKKGCPGNGYLTVLAKLSMTEKTLNGLDTFKNYPDKSTTEWGPGVTKYVTVQTYDAEVNDLSEVVARGDGRVTYNVNLNLIEENVSNGTSGFVSTIRDPNLVGKDSSKVPFMAKLAGYDGDYWIGNRSDRTKRYVGIKNLPTDIDRKLVALYRFPNDSAFYASTVNTYKDQLTTSSMVGRIQRGAGFTDTNQMYGGDCFPQKTSFLINKSFEELSEFKKDVTKYSGRNYNIGTVITIFSYNTYNSSMRSISESKIFWPYAKTKGYDSLAYITSGSEEVCFESVVLNAGNSNVLHPQIMAVASKNKPYKPMIETNLVVSSDKYIPASFESGLRKLDFTNAKTYFNELGPINAIRMRGNTIFLGHSDGVSIIQSEQQMQQTTNSGSNLLLGVGPVLPDIGESLNKFGVRSQNALFIEDGVYGIDFIRKAVWTIGDQGQVNFLDLIGMKEFSNTLFDYQTPFGFITRSVDKNNDGIYFSINGKVFILKDIDGRKQVSGIGSYSPRIAIPFKDVMLSVSDNKFYKEYDKDIPHFFGVDGSNPHMIYYVNAPDLSRQVPKLFNVISLQGKDVRPVSYALSGDNDIIYNFIVANLPFWYGLEYLEGFLSMPIPNLELAENSAESLVKDGLIGTELRSSYLKVKITYHNTESFAVRSAITVFEPSTI